MSEEISRYKRAIIVIISGSISYLTGCLLYYFFAYKNGEAHLFIIVGLVVVGMILPIMQYKNDDILFKKNGSNKTLLTIVFIIIVTFGFGLVNSLEKKRINSILKAGPTKQVIATVIDVDLRSMRTGKQPWSIINYNAGNQVVEQSFADTTKNLTTGQKYLIEYSVEYPDMFRVVKPLK